MSIKESLKERFPIDYDKFIEINENIFMKEPIPNHMKKWWYASGAMPLILLGIQVLTGILLSLYFIPSPEMAFESVRHISQDVQMGFWIRGIHRWGSNLMIIALLLHITRVFFTNSFRKPRELNWVLGVMLFLLTLGFSFTGYSLVNNQLAYWATTVGTNMFKDIPVIGSIVLDVLRGGQDVTANTLTRFFMLHVMFLPIIMIIVIAIHIIILRVHGVSEPEGYDTGHYAFYPHHFYKIILLTLFSLCVLSTLTVIFPPGLGTPADPALTPLHIKPEWYFFPSFRFLKLVPLLFGIVVTAAFILGFMFWPFLEPLVSKNIKTRTRFSYLVGSLTVIFTLTLTVWEMFFA
ncbi:MAG: cytochrome bc complex cytochrome b subunit [Calditrichia bacterium]|nr:cytochrome bc complex cytochrome b subunit [Calditrichia bacterium]